MEMGLFMDSTTMIDGTDNMDSSQMFYPQSGQ